MSHSKETWEAWVDQHYDVLLSRSRVLFRGKTERATDFLHDLLLELRKKWEDIEHPQAWISTTMRYRVADYLSQSKAPPAASQKTTQEASDVLLLMDLETAIERLPAKHRKIMSLFLEGNGIAEIASKTGLSTDAVYQRLSRARKKIKQFLGDRVHGQSVQSYPDKAFSFSG